MVLIAALAACVAQAEWETWTSEEGNFSVSAPGVLVETVAKSSPQVGDIESHVLTLDSGAFHYTVAYFDNPIPGIARANPLGALEGELRRALEQEDARLVAKHDIALDFVPGIAFRGEILTGGERKTAGLVYGEVYLADARLYRLTVVAPRYQMEQADPDRFFDSFRWLDMGAPTDDLDH
jgi:hypothetical protein